MIRSNNFKKSDLFFCYSLNLNNFLLNKINIQYISTGFNSKVNKKYYVYLRTPSLCEGLEEWENNKITGKLFIAGGGEN